MNELARVISDALTDLKQSGSDYTAKVTRVEGQTAYVQITGSDIADTPVALSIGAKKGDKVRIRIADGKAWITGNDTAPPTDDSRLRREMNDETRKLNRRISDNEGNYSKISQSVDKIALEVGGKMNADMSNRAALIEITKGLIKFLANTLVIDSANLKLDANGNATFSGTLNAASGTFKGSLSAADGTFKGNLNAAGGSFKGAVSFDWKSGTNLQKVYLGDSSKTSPFVMSWASRNVETQIQSGDVTVYYGSSTYCQMTPSGISQSSDRRLKEDIKDYEDEEKILQLRPVSYQYREDPQKRRHLGFIAQETEELIPEAIMHGEYLGLNYTELIAPIVALLQKQEKRISVLKAEVAELKEIKEKNNGCEYHI